MVLISIIAFAIMRVRQAPERTQRSSRFYGSHTSGAWIVLFLIFSVVWTLFVFRGVESAAGNLPYESGAWVSIAVGPAVHRAVADDAVRPRDGLPAAPHRRRAGLPRPGALLEAPAHLHRADQRLRQAPAQGARPAAAPRARGQADRLRGSARGGLVRSRQDRGLHVEGHARLRDVHRVRPLPVAVPRVEHRQAALAEAADHGPARPHAREGAVHDRRQGHARRGRRRPRRGVASNEPRRPRRPGVGLRAPHAAPTTSRPPARWSAPRSSSASSTPTSSGPAPPAARASSSARSTSSTSTTSSTCAATRS